jgi:hypothetical protein
MIIPVTGRNGSIHLTLGALEQCLVDLDAADMPAPAAHLDAAILTLRRELMKRGIEPDTDQSVGATG